MRRQFAPRSSICSRSRRACAGEGRVSPSASGLNGPYVTPFTKNFSLPIRKNLPSRQTRLLAFTARRCLPQLALTSVPASLEGSLTCEITDDIHTFLHPAQKRNSKPHAGKPKSVQCPKGRRRLF